MIDVVRLKGLQELKDEYQQIFFNDDKFLRIEYTNIDPIERHLKGKTRTHVFAIESNGYYKIIPETPLPDNDDDVYFFAPNPEFYEAGLLTFFNDGIIYLYNISSNTIYLNKGVIVGQTDTIDDSI